MRNELDAVNVVLRALGNAEAQSINDGDLDTISARSYLRDAKATVLKPGWYFNRFTQTFAANVDGQVILPAETTYAYASGYLLRGRKLWDIANNTYNIGAAVSAEYYVDVPWEELPISAYDAASSLAAANALVTMDGDKDKIAMLNQAHQTAMSYLRAEELQWQKFNVFNRPKISAAMQRIKPAAGYHSS